MKPQTLFVFFHFCGMAFGQQTTAAPPDFHPQVAIQHEDYLKARRHFQTKLVRVGPSPQKWTALTPPAGVTEIAYPAGSLRLKAWIHQPDTGKNNKKYPAVLFLHGGHSFSQGDWDMSRPYRDAGFVVMSPILRGENGQPGNFSMYYDEADDVIAAAEYLRHLPYVDSRRLFVAGHSVGGTMTMLSALLYKHFRAGAAFSGSPDQVIYVKYAPGAEDRAPFDITDVRELEMRSPLAFAAFFRCPLRIYYGSQEFHFDLTSQRTAEIARENGKDVEAVKVQGNHLTQVPDAIKASIEFFRQHEHN
jgi:dipeptidyl aminopeptidase/acylaminoacyl peptidase